MYKSSSSSLPNYSSSSVLCYVASPHERWWLVYRDPYIIRIVNPSPHSSGCGPKREGRGIHSLCFFLPFSFALFQSSHPHLAGTSASLPARLNLRPLHTLPLKGRFSLAITPISSNFPVRRQRHHQSLSLQLCANTRTPTAKALLASADNYGFQSAITNSFDASGSELHFPPQQAPASPKRSLSHSPRPRCLRVLLSSYTSPFKNV